MKRREEIEFLEMKSLEIRKSIIQTTYDCGRKPHPGPALSCTDLCTALFYKFMNIDPANPYRPDRDRFILSKGHACLIQYTILADLGYFPKADLKTLRHIGSPLQGHPSFGKTKGVDMTTGSLGNGLGIALGMAYYLKNEGFSSKVFTILGDGEMNEGTVWEAVNVAPKLKTDNLIAIVDQNHFQSCGGTEDIVPMLNMGQRWEAFGWKVLEVNGHDMRDIVSKLEIAVNYKGAPVCLVADTVKGKGISFMEHDNTWHQNGLNEEQYLQAMHELEEA